MASKRKAVEIIEIDEGFEDNVVIRPACYGEYCEYCDEDLCGMWYSKCVISSSINKSS